MEIDSKIPISETLNQLVDFLGDFEKVNTGKVKRKSDNIKILSEIEQLNVDVPMNREKFRQHYLESLMEFLKCD